MLVSKEFSPFIVKEYQYWYVILHENQSCLGRVTIWWKDRHTGEGERLRFDSMPPEGWMELLPIFKDIVRAWKALGHKTELLPMQGFLDNLLGLRNYVGHHRGHMHLHFIPRFAQPLHSQLLHTDFKDPNWGQGYNGLPVQELGKSGMLALRQMMAHAIG